MRTMRAARASQASTAIDSDGKSESKSIPSSGPEVEPSTRATMSAAGESGIGSQKLRWPRAERARSLRTDTLEAAGSNAGGGGIGAPAGISPKSSAAVLQTASGSHGPTRTRAELRDP